MLVFRKKLLTILAACPEGVDAFLSFTEGKKKLVISSKADAVAKAVAFVDGASDRDDAEERALFLEWFFEECVEDIMIVREVGRKASEKLFRVNNGSTRPTRKSSRRAARYLGAQLWKHRKQMKKFFKDLQ